MKRRKESSHRPSKNDEVVILPTDKGNVTVVMDRQDYM